MSFVDAGEFLAKLGAVDEITVSNGASARIAFPGATRGFHVTAIGAPMNINVGDGSVVAGPSDRKLYLSAGESKEFRRVGDQTHIAAYGVGSTGTLLVTAMDD